MSNLTGYMQIVENIIVKTKKSHLEILDMPAGNGLLAKHLTQYGYNVTCADAALNKPDYVCVNMEEALPFENSYFDAIICLEGIEHVINPYSLIKEISRILKPGGLIILSLPNVQSLYSRLTFLFTGTYYQFNPEHYRYNNGEDLLDRGHISPLSFIQLAYIFGEFGFKPITVIGDRIKRKILLPIYLVLWMINRLMLQFRYYQCHHKDVRQLYSFLMKFRPMTSRSIITVWKQSR